MFQQPGYGIMCLGIVGRVVELRGDVAVVDVNGTRFTADASVVDVSVGDYVVVHAGMIISRVSREEALEVLSLYRELEKYL